MRAGGALDRDHVLPVAGLRSSRKVVLSPYLASGGHHLAGTAGRGGLLQHARNDPGPHERVHQLRQGRTSGTAST